MLNEIRHRENSGDCHNTGRADDNGGGCYQFIDPTWKENTKASGIGTQYARGSDAPRDVQDAVALWTLRHHGTTPWTKSGPYPQLGGAVPPGPRDPASGLTKDFKGSLDTMIADAAKDGVTLKLGSGFRTYTEQARLYQNYLKYGGPPVGQAGTSKHEFGDAMDMRDASDRKIAAGSKEDQWLAANQGKHTHCSPGQERGSASAAEQDGRTGRRRGRSLSCTRCGVHGWTPSSGRAGRRPPLLPVAALTATDATAPRRHCSSRPSRRSQHRTKSDPQETDLYQQHLTNLNGPGKVLRPNGDISTRPDIGRSRRQALQHSDRLGRQDSAAQRGRETRQRSRPRQVPVLSHRAGGRRSLRGDACLHRPGHRRFPPSHRRRCRTGRSPGGGH
jgi:hypothetical protein